MKILQRIKATSVTPPAAIVDNAAFTTASVDCKDVQEVTFVVYLGALDIALSAFKLRESDDDSSYSDVSGADFSASLPAATDDNKVYAIHVSNMSGRKRYLDLSLTGGDGAAGTYATVIALTVPKAEPSTATTRGYAAELIV